ncbi:UNVERIFIED_CONTAM: putative membrane protein [Sesamum radiatum]|uniref:Membrane protein n=1 Tax=Sesamum radiatum TaxID=300843 RepID=A0AAW2LNK9_SESRA
MTLQLQFQWLIICPVALAIIAIGNSAVVVGLWPAHFLWTYYCVAKSKRLGWILKILALFSLPVPLILWPVIAIIGSVLGGIGYGFFAPLIATFEAVGENVTDKWFHCFSVSLPFALRLSKLPACVLVSLLAIPVDVPFITGVALWKSPYMLFRGWKRLLEDLVGREGPFLETVCVPFAGLAIILWPLAVIGAVLAAFLSSFFLGLYAGLIVYQGDCKKLGIKLPAWSILQCLLRSAKSGSSGLIISDQVELTKFNLPRDRVFEWFIGPLFTMKEQIKGLQLEENEEICLKKLVIACENNRPEDWDDTGFPSSDKVRRAQLQAVIRRLQGIVGSMSRLPTFRRRFKNLVKVLYVEAIQTGLVDKHIAGSSKSGRHLFGRGRRHRDAAAEDHDQSTNDVGVMV